jgi:hypothetical protein
MPQLSNGLAPEERAEILRVRPQGALCIMLTGAKLLRNVLNMNMVYMSP